LTNYRAKPLTIFATLLSIFARYHSCTDFTNCAFFRQINSCNVCTSRLIGFLEQSIF